MILHINVFADGTVRSVVNVNDVEAAVIEIAQDIEFAIIETESRAETFYVDKFASVINSPESRIVPTPVKLLKRHSIGIFLSRQ